MQVYHNSTSEVHINIVFLRVHCTLPPHPPATMPETYTFKSAPGSISFHHRVEFVLLPKRAVLPPPPARLPSPPRGDRPRGDRPRDGVRENDRPRERGSDRGMDRPSGRPSERDRDRRVSDRSRRPASPPRRRCVRLHTSYASPLLLNVCFVICAYFNAASGMEHLTVPPLPP